MGTVTVTINEKPVTIEEGSTILETARAAGFDIPTFCHSENLLPFTSCFICAVKVEGGKGNLVPSCATKVRDGMVVTVESEEITASRKMCLNLIISDHCGDCLPPCKEACPSSIDIRDFLSLTSEGKEAEAAQLIRKQAPLPGILGRICPRPCEEVCRRGRVEEPISICYMKRHIADTEIEQMGAPQLPAPAPATGKKVAVIGAGPAGMTAAYFLRLQGHDVTVYEAHAASGGMLRYGIPYYRLPDQILKQELDPIEGLGISVHYNARIGSDIQAKELEKEFDALIIAIGAQGASPMRVAGEDLEGVLSGVEYLGQSADGNAPELGDKIVVIGGGNTAIDVARSGIRTGANVTILYRRTRQEMPANSFEIDEALHEGVDIRYLAAPASLHKSDKGLTVRCIEMELGEPDGSGRRRPVPIKGSEFELSASSVIGAIGQKVAADCIADLGVELTRWGTIVADDKTFMTSREGIFACGDCETGADIAVRAVGNGRKTAVACHQYLTGEPVAGESVFFNSTMGALEDVPENVFEGYDEIPRIAMPVLTDQQRRTTFDEVETGFPVDQARKEAERCLNCGCDGIDDCLLREYATRYGVDGSMFKEGEMREHYVDSTHEQVKLETGKCLSCGSCVRACAEVKGLHVFSFVDRGFVTRMRAPFGRSLVDTTCDGCGECIKVCPTAALREKVV